VCYNKVIVETEESIFDYGMLGLLYNSTLLKLTGIYRNIYPWQRYILSIGCVIAVYGYMPYRAGLGNLANLAYYASNGFG
jgi:hypothetical protein